MRGSSRSSKDLTAYTASKCHFSPRRDTSRSGEPTLAHARQFSLTRESFSIAQYSTHPGNSFLAQARLPGGVLYVEGLKHNLLSINQLCDKGFHVPLYPDKCIIESKEFLNSKLVGKRINNIYMIYIDS
ncbi:hypothetical protein Lal_00015285 [Lupinus albus]|nr:hypothetical protein Lal_00015285 [Lupinus albus]